MPWIAACACAVAVAGATPQGAASPFIKRMEVYRADDVSAFGLRLERKWPSSAMEEIGAIRLEPAGRNAFLIYPTRARLEGDQAAFYGRVLPGEKATLILRYDTSVEEADGTRRRATREERIEVASRAEDGGPKEILRAWAQGQVDAFQASLALYPEDSFSQYVVLRTAERFGARADEALLERLAYSLYGRNPNLLRATTSSLAVAPCLQYRILKAKDLLDGTYDADAGSLSPPALPKTDWKGLRDDKGYTLSPVAHLVPEDQYMLSFRSVAVEKRFFDILDRLGDRFLVIRSLGAFLFQAPPAREAPVRAKIATLLALDEGRLREALGPEGLAPLVVSGTDLSFKEGADAALFFRVPDREAFEKAVGATRAALRERYPALATRSFFYLGQEIRTCFTPDREVSSFRVDLDDWTVFADSPVTLKRVIEARLGRRRSLAEAEDLRYFRSRTPWKAGEDGFLYFSDAFLRATLSPGRKIEERRRILCVTELLLVENAALLYRLENRKPPASVMELVEDGYLRADEVACPDGGKYRIEDGRVVCSAHNRLRFLTPIVEREAWRIGAKERAAYRAFVKEAQSLLGPLFQPVAVTVEDLAGRGMAFEMLSPPGRRFPLVSQALESVGGEPAMIKLEEEPARTFLTVHIKLRREVVARLLGQLPPLAQVLAERAEFASLDWLEETAVLGVGRGEPAIEIDPDRIRSVVGLGHAQQFAIAAGLYALQLPITLEIELEKPAIAADLLKTLARRMRPTPGAGDPMRIDYDAYELRDDPAAPPLYVYVVRPYAVNLRLFATVTGDRLLIATRRDMLREAREAVTRRAAPEERLEANLVVRYHPSEAGRDITIFPLYWEEKAREACLANIRPAHNLLVLKGVDPPDLARAALRSRGEAYVCPDGGIYRIDPERGEVICTVHGNRARPRGLPQPRMAPGVRPIVEFLLAARREDDGWLRLRLRIREGAAVEPERPGGKPKR